MSKMTTLTIDGTPHGKIQLGSDLLGAKIICMRRGDTIREINVVEDERDTWMEKATGFETLLVHMAGTSFWGRLCYLITGNLSSLLHPGETISFGYQNPKPEITK